MTRRLQRLRKLHILRLDSNLVLIDATPAAVVLHLQTYSERADNTRPPSVCENPAVSLHHRRKALLRLTSS